MTPPAAVQKLVKQTRAVWNQKAVGLIYDHYVHNVKVHRALQNLYGRGALVADTVQQLAAFPDCRLRGEQTLWDAGEQGRREPKKSDPKYYLSHWATRVAHNSGYSMFGRPTQQRVAYPVATDFLIFEDRVVEVWEVADGLLLAKQLGLRLEDAVAALSSWHRVAQLQDSSEVQRPSREDTRRADKPRAESNNSLEGWILETWHDIWNRRRLDRVAQRYRANYRFLGPSGRRHHTRDDFATFVLSLLAAFPDASVQIEHSAVVREGETAHVAVRWRLLGTHDGPGYGPPTGRSVNILGITQHHLQAGWFVAERTVFDELALWTQLHAFNSDQSVSEKEVNE